MNDAFLVRVLDRPANLNQQIQPFLGGEVVLVAVIGDFDAAHQFHDEIGPAGIRGTRVQEFRDIRMVHERQRLPLGLEPGNNTLGVHAQLDDLERHAAVDGFFLLTGIDNKPPLL